MIYVTDILNIGDPTQYKLHLACRNTDGISPLDEYVTDYSRWLGWNTWRGSRNDWSRKYIFSLIEFYPKKDTWLFGGVFEVIERHKEHYILTEVEDFRKFTGRLLLSFHRYQGMRGRAFYFEKYVDNFSVLELLSEPYRGESFPGFENVCHDFTNLEAVFKSERSDWKAALSNVKGVYLIVDKSNGKQYVGSAYGSEGIWARWACYIGTGHGWSDELTKIIAEKSIKYARENFRLSILEVMTNTTSDEEVIRRESHWKSVLLTREYGYNHN